MTFNSLSYVGLLVAVVCLFWVSSIRLRHLLIFFASLIFYGFWRFDFVGLILFSGLVDWLIAKKIYKTDNSRNRKLYLYLSLGVNISLLIYFKYLIFIAESVSGILSILGIEAPRIVHNVILPIGISFYTFQTISYTVDVYRRVINPEPSLLVYFCFVTYFPQLVAGPVLRASEVISQLKNSHRFEWQYISTGIERVLYGLFLKVVLADNIAPLVNEGFGTSADLLSAIDVWTLAFLFGFQIYFDFSAYSHIAIGSAYLMGFKFPENFNFPYSALSPKDFWNRWHISLSSWIRDYLYLPLMGVKFQTNSLGGLERAVVSGGGTFALFATWAIMGLWHGANWTFLVWGLYHATLIFIYRFVASFDFFTVPPWLAGTFCLFVMMFGWIPFRAEDVGYAFDLMVKVFAVREYGNLGLRENTYLATFLLLIGYLAFSKWEANKGCVSNFSILSVLSRFVFISTLSFLVFIFFRPVNQFIYFQF